MAEYAIAGWNKRGELCLICNEVCSYYANPIGMARDVVTFPSAEKAQEEIFSNITAKAEGRWYDAHMDRLKGCRVVRLEKNYKMVRQFDGYSVLEVE
jgi:hypothetical protein